MAVGELYRLSFNYQVYNVNCVNVFHFEQTGASSDDVAQLIQAFLDRYISLYQAYCAVEWVPLCVKASRIKPTEGSARLGIIPAGNEGLAAGECMPANQVSVISQYSAVYTKRGRGRVYISGASENFEEKNNHNAAGFAALVPIGEQLNSELVGVVADGTWQTAIFSETGDTWEQQTRYEARSPFKKLRGRTARIC